MLQIIDKRNCCGCSACVQICPKQCISFDEDKYGFRYPLVNKESCIDCGLCEKVCPSLNPGVPRKSLKVYAAINPNEEIRMKSSSGGIFTMLAEAIIDAGGVVFGARFDENWEVMHGYTETKQGIDAFRGSKYVQSRIGETYKQAREFLNNGRKVMFTGTSCQIAGLNKFLRKEYDNLLTVDVVCHGVPSPLVWRAYLKELIERPAGVVGKNTVLSSLQEKPVITGISFRDKSTGWKKFGFIVRGKSASKADQNSVLSSVNNIILHETLETNKYMQLFLKDLCLRESCSNCPSKSGKSLSDITIADYWGVSNFHSDMDDDKGTSLIICYSVKGCDFIDKYAANIVESSMDYAISGNPVIDVCVSPSSYSDIFWSMFLDGGFVKACTVLDKLKPCFFKRLYGWMRRKINTLK